MSDKIEQFWRPATADDVARVMRGEKVEARFRDQKEDCWSKSKWLGGFDATSVSGYFWISEKAGQWKFCQVYDPPEILKNKPDPSEGYRLLEKFPHEQKQTGDEWYDPGSKTWNCASESKIQRVDAWYRRRIANNPVIPDSCRSRDTIPSGWHVLSKDEERLASDAYWSLGAKDWILIGDDRVEYANRDKWYAIRRLGSFDLVVGFNYTLPNGKEIRITEKGFEVV